MEQGVDSKKDHMIESLDISNVKDINKLRLRSDAILIEVSVNVKSDLILLEDTSVNLFSTLKVVKVGDKVLNVKKGDVVLDFASTNTLSYMHSGKGKDMKKYILTNEYNITMVTEPSNIKNSK